MLDLHWRLVPWLIRDGGVEDSELWADSHSLAIGQQLAHVPAPHDLLIHVILHAYRSGWDDVPRWVADAAMLVRHAGSDLDWDRFAERVTVAHVSLPILDALNYLEARFAILVPSHVLRAVATATTPVHRDN